MFVKFRLDQFGKLVQSSRSYWRLCQTPTTERLAVVIPLDGTEGVIVVQYGDSRALAGSKVFCSATLDLGQTGDPTAVAAPLA